MKWQRKRGKIKIMYFPWGKKCRKLYYSGIPIVFNLKIVFSLIALFLLKCSRHAILCLFQVYNIEILHLYTLQCDPQKSNNHLSPYKIIMLLLPTFPVLYFISLWLVYFITESLHFLFHFTFVYSSLRAWWKAKLVCVQVSYKWQLSVWENS